MKPLASLLILLCSLLSLSAQDSSSPRKLGDLFYLETHMGLFSAGDYFAGSLHFGAGYRLTDRHSLGPGFTIAYHAAEPADRLAFGLGLQYRYQSNNWLFDAAAGRVLRHRYDLREPSPYPREVSYDLSDAWYFRLGVQRRFLRILTVGVSFFQSTNIVRDIKNLDLVPPQSFTSKKPGPQVFTINLGFLLQ